MEGVGMSITVEDLRQRIKDRREQALKPRYIELGRGIKLIAEGLDIYIVSDCDPDDRSKCGYLDPILFGYGSRWVLYRDWYTELRSLFGVLPSHVVEDGSLRAT